jgi:hypothetical protein
MAPLIDDISLGGHDALPDYRTALSVGAVSVVAVDVLVPPAIRRIEALPEQADIEPAMVFSRASVPGRQRKMGRGEDGRRNGCREDGFLQMLCYVGENSTPARIVPTFDRGLFVSLALGLGKQSSCTLAGK